MSTALDIIRYITAEIEGTNAPSRKRMIQDVQMMHYKIRPVLGDITSIKKVGAEFLEVLWKIGKIDEVIRLHIDSIPEDEQDMLLDYFATREEDMRITMRNTVTLQDAPENDSVLKLEIFKEHGLMPHLN